MEGVMEDQWPARATMVRQLQAAGSDRIRTLETVQQEIAAELRDLKANKPRVFLAMPGYGLGHDGAWLGFTVQTSDGVSLDIIRGKFTSSLLAHSFNNLWCQALQEAEVGRVTHFAMIHSDVAPSPRWLDVLWEIMEQNQAHVVSAVIPIKDHRGLTSTAIENPTSIWQIARRLTMHEVLRLPETFGEEDVKTAGLNQWGGRLLVNTGLMLVDLRPAWMRSMDENGEARIFFEIRNRVYRTPEGKYEAYVLPEDWNFSRMIYAVNPDAKLLATRRVSVEHRGEFSYSNQSDWGQWHYDQETLEIRPTEPEEEVVVAA